MKESFQEQGPQFLYAFFIIYFPQYLYYESLCLYLASPRQKCVLTSSLKPPLEYLVLLPLFCYYFSYIYF